MAWTHRLTLTCFAAALLAVLPAYAQPQPIRNGVFKYRIAIPQDWEVIPAQRIEAINGRIDAKTGIRFSTGYQPKNLVLAADGSLYPVILVQNDKKVLSGTHDDIQNMLAKSLRVQVRSVEGDSGQLVAKLTVGSAVLDRGKNRIIQRLSVNPAAGQMDQRPQGVSYGFFGRNGIVFFDCYARHDEFEAYLPVFNGVADSFQYDEGEQFVPGQTAPRNWIAIIGGCVVAFVFFVAAVLYVILKVIAINQER